MLTIILVLGLPLLSALTQIINRQHFEKTYQLTTIFTIVFLLLSIYLGITPKSHQLNVDWLIFNNSHLAITLSSDDLSIIMLLLIGTISLIVNLYASRYLYSDPNRSRFMAQLSLVTFSVAFLVMSANLLTAFIGWQLIGFNLYWLLNHYHYDEKANRAAKKKFTINRLGDMSFLLAIIICLHYYGTTDFQIILAHYSPSITVLHHSINIRTMMLSCVLLAVMTKSAQFPFHIWLPDTMQTPTPVSAIMHAGVINAGGFLLARLSAGLMLSSNLLMLIAIIGLTTLLIGNLFTIMQPDIKKKLAYSTMSQMGYMVLQCGLGCFTGAIYHLIVHGFFKAWSFLNSGNQLSVVEKKEHPSAPFYFWLIILTMSAGTFCLIKKELLSIVLAYPLLAVFMIITLVQFSIASWGNTASINQKLISFAITLTITTLYLMIIAPAAHEHFGTVNFSFQILAGTMILSCLGMYYLLPLNPKILYRFCYLIHNKLFIEEWYRETLLTPIREIGDHLNRLLSIHRFLLISLGTTILVAIFFSHDFNAIKISFTAVFLCLTLIVFLLAANRGHRLIDIAIYFILSQYTISAIAFLFSSNHGREIAYYQIVNASVVSLLMLYTLYKIKKANNIKTLALSHNENKLPWLSFYTTISLFLMIGLPFTPMFITEIAVLTEAMASMPIVVVGLLASMLLLTIGVLHTLQDHVFKKSRIKNLSIPLSLSSHCIYIMLIIFNIVNGVMPTWLIGLLYRGAHYR